MPEDNWSALVRDYEEIARNLDMPDDMCFVGLEQGCHVGAGDHQCACLRCIRSGAAFAEEE